MRTGSDGTSSTTARTTAVMAAATRRPRGSTWVGWDMMLLRWDGWHRLGEKAEVCRC